MKRRDFLRTAALGTASAMVALRAEAAEESETVRLARKLPRWRGFNLLEKFNGRNDAFRESDFEWMAEWGFDFVRLPMDYKMWTDPEDPYRLNENSLREIDQVVEFGRQHGIHVSLNLHRAPGYTVARPPEKLNLWKDEEAQKQFDFQWSQFAKRYLGIPSSQVSFDLVNEPANVSADAYAKVARRAVAAIRRVDPQRLIISDGLQWGRDPIFQLADLGIAQSTRGYDPMEITHYKASWVNSRGWAKPSWPLKKGNRVLDRDWLYRDRIVPWKKLAAGGVGVHVGEWGVFNKTPHDVVLSWAGDFLQLWKEAGFGWALWNFRGSFGILDSGRADIAYENFRGHKLDRKLLELLLQF